MRQNDEPHKLQGPLLSGESAGLAQGTIHPVDVIAPPGCTGGKAQEEALLGKAARDCQASPACHRCPLGSMPPAE